MDKKAKILVTGGTGLLGSYILRYLVQDGFENIYAIIRLNSKKDLLNNDLSSNINWIIGDILDLPFLEETINDKDYIIHAAAEVHLGRKYKNKLYENNVTGTANIVNTCLLLGIKKLVYISSTAALGRIYNNQKIDEQTMWENSILNTHYAISKHEGELEVWRGHEEGLNICILNPSLIITPGHFDKSSASLYSRIYNKMKYYPIGTNGVIDVRDAAKLSLLLLMHNKSNFRLIACAGSIPYKDLFSRIALGLNRQIPTVPVQKVHRYIINIFSRLKNILGFNSNLSKAALLNSSMNFYYNNEQSISLFSFQYRDINSSIEEACKYYLEAKDQKQNYCILPL